MIQFEPINIPEKAQEAIYISVKEFTSVESSDNHTGEKTTKEVKKIQKFARCKRVVGKSLKQKADMEIKSSSVISTCFHNILHINIMLNQVSSTIQLGPEHFNYLQAILFACPK